MGQRRSNAAMKDVQNRYRKEDYVSNTERRDIVAMKDVPTMCRMEEFVSGMVRHGQERRELEGCNNYARKGGVCVKHC